MLIDGAQSIQHIPTDVAELGADFYVFSPIAAVRPTFRRGGCAGEQRHRCRMSHERSGMGRCRTETLGLRVSGIDSSTPAPAAGDFVVLSALVLASYRA